MGEYTVTPETEPDVEDGLSCFTLENDEIPPGMDQASVPDPSSYGVSSRPSSSNFSYLSASSLSHNEPEITIPKKRRERENSLERLSEYCPEDVASDFFKYFERTTYMSLAPDYEKISNRYSHSFDSYLLLKVITMAKSKIAISVSQYYK